MIGLDEELLLVGEVESDGIIASVRRNELIDELSLALAAFDSLKVVPLAVDDSFVLRIFYLYLHIALLTSHLMYS